MKTCSVCGDSKPFDAFKRHAASPDGRTYVCKDCLCARREEVAHLTPEERWQRQLAILRERYQDDPEYRERLKNHRRKSAYGVSPEIYQAIYDRQRGLCAICREAESGKGFHLDHDHATGQIRGLLCFMCNRGLGDFVDDVGRMGDAIRYLTERRDPLVVVPPKPRVRAQCGTTSGYTRHRRLGEPQCDACLRAWSEYNSAKTRERAAGRTSQRREVAVCGTHAGYTAHYTRHEKPCDACKEAKRQYLASRKAK